MAVTDEGVRADVTAPAPGRRRPVAVVVAFLAVLVVASVLRVLWSGPLWLDESLSAEIAGRPLGAMFTALRHDGSPPLYYLLLHGWIALFGAGTGAVRALSSVFGLASLPLAWWAGRTLGGRRLAAWTVLVVAVAPWVFRYSTETRMYMLLFDLVLLGIPLLTRALARPSAGRLVAVGLDTLAVAYTHYWGLYLIAPLAVGLVLARRWRVLGAMAVSALGYLPWLPSLLYQLRHTGTPWAQPPSLSIFTDTVGGWGGAGQTGPLLGIGLLGLAVLALVRAPVVWRTRSRLLAAGAAAPLVVALALGLITHAGYAIRYTAVALPAFLVLVAVGLMLTPRPAQTVAAGLVVVLGLVGGVAAAATSRTQAGGVAAVLAAQARPGDVVGYCPDQLSPAVARLLPASLGLTQIAYADPTEGPALVDWVDYAQRIAQVSPQQFADHLLSAAGPGHTVWLVASDGYRLFAGTCPAVAQILANARGAAVPYVALHGSVLEHESLAAYPVRVAG